MFAINALVAQPRHLFGQPLQQNVVNLGRSDAFHTRF
jgi:hypothetical protein